MWEKFCLLENASLFVDIGFGASAVKTPLGVMLD
jgi:hypothetical protein